MERKIGEIFEYNGDWYQCIEGTCNKECYFYNSLHETIADINGNGFGACNYYFRSDNKSVIFKKLEKVGEPYGFQKRTFQTYKLHTIPFLLENVELVAIPSKDNNTIEIELKQTKEDMKENYKAEDTLLTRLVGRYVNNLIDYETFEKAVKELYSDKKDSKPTLKEFDLEAAKQGKPVCTRDGRKARIICFDAKGKQPIIALFEREKSDEVIIQTYNDDGSYYGLEKEDNRDLVMIPEKKEGWILLRKDGCVFDNEKVAQKNCTDDYFVAKVEWEE